MRFRGPRGGAAGLRTPEADSCCGRRCGRRWWSAGSVIGVTGGVLVDRTVGGSGLRDADLRAGVRRSAVVDPRCRQLGHGCQRDGRRGEARRCAKQTAASV